MSSDGIQLNGHIVLFDMLGTYMCCCMTGAPLSSPPPSRSFTSTELRTRVIQWHTPHLYDMFRDNTEFCGSELNIESW